MEIIVVAIFSAIMLLFLVLMILVVGHALYWMKVCREVDKMMDEMIDKNQIQQAWANDDINQLG